MLIQSIIEIFLTYPFLALAAIGAGAMLVQIIFKAWENSK